MLNKILDAEIFTIEGWSFYGHTFVGLLVLGFFMGLAWRMTKAKWRLNLYKRFSIGVDERRKFEKYLRRLIIFVGLFFALKVLRLDVPFYTGEDFTLKISLFILALIVLTMTRITDWVISNTITISEDDNYKELYPKKNEASFVTKMVQLIVIILATIIILRQTNLDFSLSPIDTDGQKIEFRISKLLIAGLVLVIARLFAWFFTRVILTNIYNRRGIDQGARFAVNQLLKYVIYVIAILIALHTLNINMTIVLGGAAALLVGIGLGLQQTFNDFFSGLVLLFERSVSVGDILDFGDNRGTVKKIGLRASIIETRENVSVIIPNSKLVNDNVRNWTHFVEYGRFEVSVGVAYGTDTKLVKKLLLQIAHDHPLILEYPTPFVRFRDFADSSLNFSIFFFSKNFLIIEDIKSDLRFEIDAAFREHNVDIPFPQRDVWIKKADNGQ